MMYPSNLPIDQLHPELAKQWRQPGIALIKAPPGAGKSSMIPLWCLSWLDQPGQIWLIQPRRLACKALAARLARLLGEPLGQQVGYQIGLEQQQSSGCRILVMTLGVLLNKLQQDPSLSASACVLLDEFHERQWQADLSLALLHQLCQLRDDFRLWLLSATLDLAPLAQALQAPSYACQGRQYPVSLQYQAVAQTHWAELVAAQLRCGRRGILFFLPGWREIQRLDQDCQGLRQEFPDLSIQWLHSSIDKEQQQQVLSYQADQGPRLVLSTNIAETSLTLDGIDLVMDSGLVNQVSLDPSSGLNRRQQIRIAKSNADQRQGRAGRTQAGHCIRLWSSEERLAPQPMADIRQTDLRPVRLLLAELREQPEQLFWLDELSSHAWQKAEKQLQQLEALHQGKVTPLGQAMLALGTDLSLASMLLRAPKAEVQQAASLAAWLHLWPEKLPESPPSKPRLQEFSLLLTRFCQARKASMHFAWPEQPGNLLALAMPERLSLLDQQPAKLAAGPQVLNPNPGLRGWQLAINSQLSTQGVRVYQWLAVDEDRVRLLAHLWHQRFSHEWQQQRLQCWQHRCFMAIELDKRPAKAKLGDWHQALIQRLAGNDWQSLLTEKAQQYLTRWHCYQQLFPECPSLQDWQQQLKQQLPLWLPQVCEFNQIPWLALWQDFLADQHQALERSLPTHLSLPIGMQLAIDYSKVPALAQVKLQAAFGLQRLPVLAEGRLTLALELLAPNGRVLARTSDLDHFWQVQYPLIRKENRARYSKHPWPEDPFSQQATLKTNAQLRNNSHG